MRALLAAVVLLAGCDRGLDYSAGPLHAQQTDWASTDDLIGVWGPPCEVTSVPGGELWEYRALPTPSGAWGRGDCAPAGRPYVYWVHDSVPVLVGWSE